jgi:hypothetical protein
MYINYCHECGRTLSSGEADRCERCAWLRCECGACGCTYERLSAAPVLATVPPMLGALAPRHVASARAGGSRLAALGPAVIFASVAVLLAVGIAAAVSFVAPEVVEAPEIAASAAAPEAPAVEVLPAPAAIEESAPASLAENPPEPAAPASAAAAPAAASASASAPAAGSASANAAAASTAGAAPAAPAAAVPPAAPAASAPAAETPPRPPPLPSVLYVGNSDGQGVYLRSQPRDGNDTRIFAWLDGTAMTPLETTTVQEARGPAVWVYVRDPRGQTGWVRQIYLRPTR